MRKRYVQARPFLASLPKPKFFIGWRKAMCVVGIIGTAIVGVSGPVQAATSSSDQGFYQDATLPAPKLGQNTLGSRDGRYFSTTVERNRGTEPQMKVSGMAATATSRCPAFASWEDWWGGARVHASINFHPSDLCNGRHVKAAYVRLIRQCGPYFDTGRIYTYTASSISDTRLYSVSAWIFDSPLWGCVTSAKYGYDYF